VEAVNVYDPAGEHYRAKLDRGIDPNEDWRLIWSFMDSDAAYAEACQSAASSIFQNGLEVRTKDIGVSLYSPSFIMRLDFKGLGGS
jgi:hypothetical protein